jgi:choline-sulfatase
VDKFDDGWQPVDKPELFFSEGHDKGFLLDERQYYDEYIAYVDAEFGRLFDFMKKNGFLENTYLIFTSDHGEMFERGIYTHLTPTLYEPIIRVPFLMSAPGQTQRQDIFSLTSCVDILPTLLHLTGNGIPDWCEGQILPGFGDKEDTSGRSIFALEAKENPMQAPLEKATLALIKGQHKLVHYFGYEKHPHDYEFYDLESDPEELEDLYPTMAPVIGAMQDELIAKLTQVNRPFVDPSSRGE